MVSARSTALGTNPSTPSVSSRPSAPSDSDRRSRAERLVPLALALPFVLLALLLDDRGGAGRNAELLERGRAVQWGAGDLGFVATSYPPLPTALAALLRSELALAVVGALAVGVLLDTVRRRLRRSGLPPTVRATLVTSVAASPAVVVLATADLSVLLSLVLLALATEGFLRFVLEGRTGGGFRSGLCIGLAFLCHPVALVAAVGFGVTGPVLARRRLRGHRAAGRATALVLVFPTVAGVLGWTYLCWRFTGSPLVWLHAWEPAAADVAQGSPVPALLSVVSPVLVSPLCLLVPLVVLLSGRRGPFLGIAVAGACLVGAAWVGLGYPAAAVTTALTVVAVVTVPTQVPRSWLVAITATAALGVLAQWWAVGADAGAATALVDLVREGLAQRR